MKDFVYVVRNGNLSSEPADAFKQWMGKHDYDPEHGKNTPTQLAPTQGAVGTTAARTTATSAATPAPATPAASSAPPQ